MTGNRKNPAERIQDDLLLILHDPEERMDPFLNLVRGNNRC